MTSDALTNFPRQFEFEPKVENEAHLKPATRFVVAGMGGSHLAADVIKIWNPILNLVIHSDYALPPLGEENWENALVIASSYSGNTEEPIDTFKHALKKGIPTAVISIGGELLKLAKEASVPYIQLPDTGIQPRWALGFSAVAMLRLMGQSKGLEDMRRAARRLNVEQASAEGKKLAERIRGYMPVIYSSTRNKAIALNWKIRFNETGKVPSFYNVFPEMNHNEAISFEARGVTKKFSDSFYFILLRDEEDHPLIQVRMGVLAEMYGKLGLKIETIDIEGGTAWDKILSAIMLADWASLYTGEGYGLNPEAVEFVEEFKILVKERGAS